MPTPPTPRLRSPEPVVETPRCIAVVDDDSAARTSLSRLLRAGGYRIVAFASGNDFLESLNVYLPKCVLVDFSMPGLSGLDVVSKLRADRIEIPAIIITGTDDAELEAKSIDAGARALLRKPISEHRLFAAIESVLAGELITQNG